MGKKSKIGKGKLAKMLVLRGSREKTSGGLTKAQLTKNKSGKVVSKKASERAKKRFANSALSKWNKACKAAKKELGIKGFVAVNGKTAQGRACTQRPRRSTKPEKGVVESNMFVFD